MRRVPDSFANCLRMDDVEIDANRAQSQHRELVATLEHLVDEVVFIEPTVQHPDGCFVEDTAILLGDLAVMTRPGAESRRGEVSEVESVLKQFMEVVHLKEGTLDGGDVMRVGSTLFVGKSTRTDVAGVNALREICTPLGIQCEEVPVKSGLHLKSACTVVDEKTLVVLPTVLDSAFFEALGLKVIEVSEPFGANVLPIGRKVLVSASAPLTEAKLQAEGYETLTIDVSELHKADGALTCLSLRWAQSEAWCP